MAKAKYPAAPMWLDDIAKSKWKELIKLLDLKQQDLLALEQYCVCYSKWRRAEDILAIKGFTQIGKTDYENQRPEVAVANNALSCLNTLSKELCMTPSARARISKNEGMSHDDEDPEMTDMIS